MKRKILLTCLVSALLASSVGFAHDAPDQSHVFGATDSIGDAWMVDPGVDLAVPGYPAARSSRRSGNVCIVLGYKIGTDGTTLDFSLLKQWNSRMGKDVPTISFLENFAKAGADAVSQWKFKPQAGMNEPASTYTTIALLFAGEDGIDDSGKVLNQCRIADMDAYLVTLTRNGHRRDSIAARMQSRPYGVTQLVDQHEFRSPTATVTRHGQ